MLWGLRPKIYIKSRVTLDLRLFNELVGLNGKFVVFLISLGSPHDGDSTSAACPLSDGYIMHTSGGMDENRFKFSECSKDAMRSYIDSEEGSCLFVNNAVGDPLPVPDKNPGDIFSIEMYCVLTYGPDATVKVANDMCASMQCRWPGPCPEPDEAYTCTWSGTNFQPAPDGASCGEADAGTVSL